MDRAKELYGKPTNILLSELHFVVSLQHVMQRRQSMLDKATTALFPQRIRSST